MNDGFRGARPPALAPGAERGAVLATLAVLAARAKGVPFRRAWPFGTPDVPTVLNERLIVAITERLKKLLLGFAGCSVEQVATKLDLPVDVVRRVLERRPGALIATDALIDVLAAVVHEYGVDSSWLLTGEYRNTTHRHLEENGPLPLPSVRTAIAEQLSAAS